MVEHFISLIIITSFFTTLKNEPLLFLLFYNLNLLSLWDFNFVLRTLPRPLLCLTKRLLYARFIKSSGWNLFPVYSAARFFKHHLFTFETYSTSFPSACFIIYFERFLCLHKTAKKNWSKVNIWAVLRRVLRCFYLFIHVSDIKALILRVSRPSREIRFDPVVRDGGKATF